MASRREPSDLRLSSERGVFMISVAAELADMHPQTLRMYEARGLIEPKRSPKGTRLYSQADVERLRRIQRMTAELGLNLAGVERVLALEAEIERLRGRVATLERTAKDLRARLAAATSGDGVGVELIPLPGGGALVRRVGLGQMLVPRARGQRRTTSS
jgi:MerR family transcriptional regulator/heat shock protein HspR